jgi:hypothetical protein
MNKQYKAAKNRPLTEEEKVFVTGPQFVIPEPLTRAGGAARIQISPDDDP